MNSLLISGGTIVNEGRRFRGYIVVRDGVITEIGEGDYIGDIGGSRLDATGKIVMPGVIDCHVHFREPGLTHKGDMASESAAAVAGGVTSVFERPNTLPPATTLDTLERKFDLAAGRMHTNYSFFLGATAQNLAEIKKLNLKNSCGVKLFIGSSTGDMLVDDEKAIRALFAEFGGVISAHCEDETIIRTNTDFYRRREGDNATAAIHPLVRSEEACYVATSRAVELADRYGTHFHVAHVTTARELALFGGGPVGSKKITAEACVPHLWFTDEDYPRLGNRIKCNPAIKTAADRAALREALSTGRIDMIATDHAPHTVEEKSRGYWEAPSGIPSVQHSLPVMFTLAGQGILTLETLVERMCHAPARRFGITERGFLRTGYKADIAIVDPEVKDSAGRPGWTVTPENILCKCGWSPWEGVRLGAKVVCTIVGGRIAWDGERVSDVATGERLIFG
jgi:dihydroorotase